MTATSTAALLDTPFPSGTALCTSTDRPSGKVAPRSRISTTSAPATYAAQLRGEPGFQGVKEASQGSGVQKVTYKPQQHNVYIASLHFYMYVDG